jgi:hypothetical protein
MPQGLGKRRTVITLSQSNQPFRVQLFAANGANWAANAMLFGYQWLLVMFLICSHDMLLFSP